MNHKIIIDDLWDAIKSSKGKSAKQYGAFNALVHPKILQAANEDEIDYLKGHYDTESLKLRISRHL